VIFAGVVDAIQSLQGEPIEDVANDLFHAWGIGRKGEDDGALVLLAIQDHRSRLEVGGGLGGVIPDGNGGASARRYAPALRQNQYGPAFLAAAECVGSTIAQVDWRERRGFQHRDPVGLRRRTRRTENETEPEYAFRTAGCDGCRENGAGTGSVELGWKVTEVTTDRFRPPGQWDG
jgi:hypothetical protein